MAQDRDPHSFGEAITALKPNWYVWLANGVVLPALLVLIYASVSGNVSSAIIWTAFILLAGFTIVETGLCLLAYFAYWRAL